MPTTYEKIEQSALSLNHAERAALAKRLLLSLEDHIDHEVEQAWIEEINRRKAQAKAGEVELVPADEVLAKARQLLSR